MECATNAGSVSLVIVPQYQASPYPICFPVHETAGKDGKSISKELRFRYRGAIYYKLKMS